MRQKARDRLKRSGHLQRVDLKTDDGTAGWEAYAPYDAILVAAGGPDIPVSRSSHQLKVGGRLVIPSGRRPKIRMLVRAAQNRKGLSRRRISALCAFVPLIGKHGWRQNNRTRLPASICLTFLLPSKLLRQPFNNGIVDILHQLREILNPKFLIDWMLDFLGGYVYFGCGS